MMYNEQKHTIYVRFLTETHCTRQQLSGDDISSDKTFAVYRHDQWRTGGGITIFIHTGLIQKSLATEQTPLEVVSAHIFTSSKVHFFCLFSSNIKQESFLITLINCS